MKRTQFDEGVRIGAIPPPIELLEGQRPIGFIVSELDEYVEKRRKVRDEKIAKLKEAEALRETKAQPRSNPPVSPKAPRVPARRRGLAAPKDTESEMRER
jgi:hypothetical protein